MILIVESTTSNPCSRASLIWKWNHAGLFKPISTIPSNELEFPALIGQADVPDVCVFCRFTGDSGKTWHSVRVQ